MNYTFIMNYTYIHTYIHYELYILCSTFMARLNISRALCNYRQIGVMPGRTEPWIDLILFLPQKVPPSVSHTHCQTSKRGGPHKSKCSQVLTWAPRCNAMQCNVLENASVGVETSHSVLLFAANVVSQTSAAIWNRMEHNSFGQEEVTVII